MKYYEFNQNNSGGYFDTDENVCHRVIIEAENEQDAIKKFEPMIENQSGSCPCCGDRWSPSYLDDIDLDGINKNGYPAEVFTDGDYISKWNSLYGNFEQIEPPKVFKKYSFKQYGTKVKFRNVVEYLQFLANRYGATSPDIRIHYANGEKLEIFSKV